MSSHLQIQRLPISSHLPDQDKTQSLSIIHMIKPVPLLHPSHLLSPHLHFNHISHCGIRSIQQPYTQPRTFHWLSPQRKVFSPRYLHDFFLHFIWVLAQMTSYKRDLPHTESLSDPIILLYFYSSQHITYLLSLYLKCTSSSKSYPQFINIVQSYIPNTNKYLLTVFNKYLLHK